MCKFAVFDFRNLFADRPLSAHNSECKKAAIQKQHNKLCI